MKAKSSQTTNQHLNSYSRTKESNWTVRSAWKPLIPAPSRILQIQQRLNRTPHRQSSQITSKDHPHQITHRNRGSQSSWRTAGVGRMTPLQSLFFAATCSTGCVSRTGAMRRVLSAATINALKRHAPVKHLSVVITSSCWCAWYVGSSDASTLRQWLKPLKTTQMRAAQIMSNRRSHHKTTIQLVCSLWNKRDTQWHTMRKPSTSMHRTLKVKMCGISTK